MEQNMIYKRFYMVIAIVGVTGMVYARGNSTSALEKGCLSCHQAQQIPSEMIYRRYLMRYASKKTIKKKIAAYLKHPSTETSIMPAPFFRKFPLKKATTLDDKRLKRLIEAYIAYYDVDGKIVIVTQDE